MKKTIWLTAAFLVMNLSCESMYQYDFYVTNNSSKVVSVVVSELANNQTNSYANDTFTNVASNSTVHIYTDESWGQLRNIAAPSDSVPRYTKIDNLRIYRNDSLLYHQDPIDFSKWQKSGVTSGPGNCAYTFVFSDQMKQ